MLCWIFKAWNIFLKQESGLTLLDLSAAFLMMLFVPVNFSKSFYRTAVFILKFSYISLYLAHTKQMVALDLSKDNQ